jgi:hypothetical protein
MDYRTALKAKGIKPIPPAHKLRTVKRPGDIEQTPTGWHIHGKEAA